ncbi:MAG: hypothetical protein FJX74_06245 [Armatimonadetes bacterium]|nr:hypothetical protein [Armatimonadota bacterium]
MLLHPHFLWGLLGAAVPVLIHLLARRRARRVRFPSLRLLRAAERKRRTLARLHQPLSLLLRVLAVCLIAVGLAGPVAQHAPAWLPLPRAQAVAILLDDTLSMTSPVAGGTLFEGARSGAEGCLAGLGPNDRVALIRLSAPDEAGWVRLREARQRLEAMQPTASAAGIAPSLWRAQELFAEIRAPNRAVLIVTDLQAGAWENPAPTTAGLDAERVVVCDVGDRTAGNVAVTDLAPVTPDEIVGRPVRLQATATASSADGRRGRPRQVVLQLQADGRPLAASEQGLREGAPGVAQLSFVPSRAEDVVVSAGIAGGPLGLSLDDIRYRTARVRPPLRIVVAATGEDGRYVSTALNPFGTADRTGARVRLVDPADLGEEVASGGLDLVILANCPALDGSAEQALAMQISVGGGVLVFLGDGADARYLAEELIPRAVGDRSLRVGVPLKASAGEALALTEIDTTRRPLSVFANPRAGDLGALRFTRARGLQVGPQARVLASFDNGAPALVEWSGGKGRLVLFNTSADESWGRHIRAAAYVPLLHRLAAHLARPARPSIPDVLVGERPVIRDAEPPREVTWTPPDGEPETVLVEDGALPGVKVPGAYRVEWGGRALAFAVNADPRESDLTRTTEAEIRAALAPGPVTFVDADGAGRLAAGLPERADLSTPLLLLAAALLLFESVFSIVRRGPEGESTASHPV